jgi:type II secretory pathway component PulJ
MKRCLSNLAFTILEMTLALAATAILMLALLTVIASLGRSMAQANKGLAAQSETRAAVRRLLARDVMNARFFRQSKKGNWIALRGYGALQVDSFERTARPVDVLYRIVTSESELNGNQSSVGDTILRREQQSLPTARGSIDTTRENASTGVKSIRLIANLENSTKLADKVSAKSDLNAGSEWLPLPSAVRIELTDVDNTVTSEDVFR